jgi:hypothetical protein
VQALLTDNIMSGYYSTEDGFFKPVCEQATQIFDDFISALYKQGKRVIRVLEVGAGMRPELVINNVETNV